MARYNKGANAERELLGMFYSAGFAVVRVAGSGASKYPEPDCLALKKEKKFAFECKARSGKYLNIPKEQLESLVAWANQAGLTAYIAWKMPRKGWLFIKPACFVLRKKGYAISMDAALRLGQTFEDISQKEVKK
ncbi:MAG: Holliday junction resolvase Hjc [Candidatus Diapherotrites archaeon]|nr:Holliday junction resolvase Hjc [Candidatus Diapherotrites archaeon]